MLIILIYNSVHFAPFADFIPRYQCDFRALPLCVPVQIAYSGPSTLIYGAVMAPAWTVAQLNRTVQFVAFGSKRIWLTFVDGNSSAPRRSCSVRPPFSQLVREERTLRDRPQGHRA